MLTFPPLELGPVLREHSHLKLPVVEWASPAGRGLQLCCLWLRGNAAPHPSPVPQRMKQRGCLGSVCPCCLTRTRGEGNASHYRELRRKNIFPFRLSRHREITQAQYWFRVVSGIFEPVCLLAPGNLSWQSVGGRPLVSFHLLLKRSGFTPEHCKTHKKQEVEKTFLPNGNCFPLTCTPA